MANLDLVQGTLEFLILRTLNWGPQHGFGVARWIRTVTHDRLQIEDGALYPALHRMEAKGWVAAKWRLTENNRQAKFYELTAKGRKQLVAQTSVWNGYVDAVKQIIAASSASAEAARG
ncbi:MAG TPA: PadR family transcriptional regulator [Gemmatimonadaceae bacterium]|nr:PadR family transcriptional regulator [Gemmatimonadaceae bacterium]